MHFHSYFSEMIGLIFCQDNYSVLLGHFIRQNGVNAEDVRQYLGIGETYEDLD
jgi:hypothetical protein